MKEQEALSPFEFKEELVQLATSHSEHMMLNAGRGNPNFLATLPRHAYLRLGDFALKEAERSYSYLESMFGGMPEKKGIVERFDNYVAIHESQDGVDFLRAMLAFADDHMGFHKEDFLDEMVNAFLGNSYPYPPRMLTLCEQVVKRYLQKELFPHAEAPAEFDLFATEGGTAAMTYLFHSLQINGLVQKGDKVAMITPIFSPYLEIPVLPEYGMDIVHIRADEALDWQVSKQELAKLSDPAIKVCCLVNPSNPPSVKMSDAVLTEISDIVNNKRQDLILITDDVYATFADDFESLFARCPKNTLCVYSFSKYFGATGWRLGVIAAHHDNIVDELIAKQDEKTLTRLDHHYASLTPKPRELAFIDRLVADSRTVALNHTAGISLPQQLQMMLFAMASLLDNANRYRHAAKDLIRRRYKILYQAISPQLAKLKDPHFVGYYTLLDLEILASTLYSDKFAKWILKNCSGNDFLRHLAEETSVVLLPGKGFDVQHPSARVSLANLRECDYRAIGVAIKQLLAELYAQYQ